MAVRYESSGMGPKIVVLALAAILAGLVYVFWGSIKDRITGDQTFVPPKDVPDRREPRRAERPPARPVKPERTPVVEHRVEPTPPRRSGPTQADLARAQELRAQGNIALQELEFQTAAELYGMEARTISKDPEAAAEARDLRTRAETFHSLFKDVKRNPETMGNLVILKYHDGRRSQFALIEETDEAYIVARSGNIRGEIPKADVAEVIAVSGDARLEKARREFAALESKRSESTGVSHYLLAKRAYAEGLDDKALVHLQKAYDKDGASLPDSYRRYMASQILLRAMWCETTGRKTQAKMWASRLKRLYPEQTELVADTDEFLAQLDTTHTSSVVIKVAEAPAAAPASQDEQAVPQSEQVASVEIAEVSSRSVRNRETMQQINDIFKQAMDHYVAGRPGSPNSNKHLSQAVQLFDKVIALCDQALKNDPGNSEIESRQADASRFGYHARKMKTLGLNG